MGRSIGVTGLTRAEHETVVIGNLGDMDAGWFTVETTEITVLNRLKKSCGSKLQIESRISQTTGKLTGWLCKVPAEYWRPPFGLRARPRGSKARDLLTRAGVG